jgi:WD40-like Beta Propeller Repeat
MTSAHRYALLAAIVLTAVAVLAGGKPSASARTARTGTTWIVLGSNRDGSTRGYSIRADGLRLTPLLGPTQQLVPRVVSRDGSTVAYHSDKFDVYVSRANGTGLRRLVQEAVPEAISRDGRLLAFLREGIWIIRTDGSGLRRVTSGESDEAPDWSPDLRSLVYAEWAGTGSRLVVKRLDGGRHVLAPVGSNSARWSPDGRWIAYVLDERDRSDRDGLYVVQPNGARRHRVARGSLYAAVWSPDGSRLAFEDGSHIGIVRSDGRGLKRLQLRLSGIGAPAWSPDGRRLALASGGGSQVWVVGVDGRGLRRLAAGGENTVVGWTRLAPVRPPAGPLLPSERVLGARSVATRRPVTDLSADGGRVALAVATRTAVDCDHVVVWTPANRALRRFGRPARCEEFNSAGAIYDVELAGSRAAWAAIGGCGNFCDALLRSATLGQPRSLTLSYLTGATSSSDAEWDHHLHGHGDLLVFDDRSVAEDEAAARLVRIGVGSEKCAERGDATTSICTTIRRGAHACCVDDVSRGLIAVRESDAVALLDAQGKVVRMFAFKPRDVRAARLDGNRLVVARPGVIEGFDVATGASVVQRSLPNGYELVDADEEIVVLRRASSVIVLRLGDGRSFTITLGRGPVSAELEESGLYYAYATADGGGRVVFLPRSEVSSRLGGSAR